MPDVRYNLNRLEFIDLLKGFAIFLVVMGHFLAWNIPENYQPNFAQTFVYRLIYSFHMPLFFFLSGYLVDIKRNKWNGPFFVTFFKKRSLSLLLPAISFLFIRYLRFGTWEFQWFLICLFNMQLFFAISKAFSEKIGGSFKVEVVVFIIFWIGLKLFCHYFSNYSFLSFFSIHVACRDFIFFYLGYIAMRFNLVEKFAEKNVVYSISLMLFILCFFLSNLGIFNHLRFLTAVSAIVVCVLFAYKKDGTSRISKLMERCGVSSLAIYLLSPFFIPYIPELGRYIMLADGFHPANMPHAVHISTIFVQLFFGVLMTIYSCAASLLLKSLFDKSDILALFLFGKKK